MDPADELRGVWGFPAITLMHNESIEAGIKRAGKQKLGVEVEIIRKIGDRTEIRNGNSIHLTDYEVKIVKGNPHVPQSDTTVSQYIDYRYINDPTMLFDAAKRGSLCIQIFLKSVGVPWS